MPTSKIHYYYHNYSIFFDVSCPTKENQISARLSYKIIQKDLLSTQFCIVENTSYIDYCSTYSYILTESKANDFIYALPVMESRLLFDLAGNITVDFPTLSSISSNVTFRGLSEFQNKVYIHETSFVTLRLHNVAVYSNSSLNIRYLYAHQSSVANVPSIRVNTLHCDGPTYMSSDNITSGVIIYESSTDSTITAINDTLIVGSTVIRTNARLSIQLKYIPTLKIYVFSNILSSVSIVKADDNPPDLYSILYSQYTDDVTDYFNVVGYKTIFLTEKMPKNIIVYNDFQFPSNILAFSFNKIFLKKDASLLVNTTSRVIINVKNLTITNGTSSTHAHFVADLVVIDGNFISPYFTFEASTILITSKTNVCVHLDFLDNTTIHTITIIVEYLMASVPFITFPAINTHNISFYMILKNVGGPSQLLFDDKTDKMSVQILSFPTFTTPKILNVSFISDSWPFNGATSKFELTQEIIAIYNYFSISKIGPKHNWTEEDGESKDGFSLSPEFIALLSCAIIIFIAVIILIVFFFRKIYYKDRAQQFITTDLDTPLI